MSLKFDDDFDKGLGYTRLLHAVDGSGGRGFDTNDEVFKTMMDSGASDSSAGKELPAGVWCGTEIGITIRRRSRRPSYLLVTGRHPRPQLTPSRETMVDQAGRPVPVRISTMAVPGLERNPLLFCQGHAIESNHHPRDEEKQRLVFRQRRVASAEPAPERQGSVLVRRVSSHAGSSR